MSKQSDAKEAQQYVAKAPPQTCGVCRNCVPVIGAVLIYKNPKSIADGTHYVDTQVAQKCSIGGFAVKKMGTCRMWLPLLPDTAEVSTPQGVTRTPGHASGDENE